ncbi:MAG: 50S ribosomal protein L24 [Chitinophagaceae bacterium]|nr:50S ribosomal protein L24 [Chitinophagaceae bacterium]
MTKRFKPKFNIKKGDQVVVIAGDDRDLKKPRKVLEVILEKGRVVVEGANIVTKHTKPSAQNTKGGLVKMEASINISNVMLWDVKAGAATKVKRDRQDGKLVRIAKKSGEVIK